MNIEHIKEFISKILEDAGFVKSDGVIKDNELRYWFAGGYHLNEKKLKETLELQYQYFGYTWFLEDINLSSLLDTILVLQTRFIEDNPIPEETYNDTEKSIIQSYEGYISGFDPIRFFSDGSDHRFMYCIIFKKNEA